MGLLLPCWCPCKEMTAVFAHFHSILNQALLALGGRFFPVSSHRFCPPLITLHFGIGPRFRWSAITVDGSSVCILHRRPDTSKFCVVGRREDMVVGWQFDPDSGTQETLFRAKVSPAPTDVKSLETLFMRCRLRRDGEEHQLSAVTVEYDPNAKSYALVRYHIPISDGVSLEPVAQRFHVPLFHQQSQMFKVVSLTVSRTADDVVVATQDLTLAKSTTQLKIFAWNRYESTFDFKWDFNMRSPLCKVSLCPSATTDSLGSVDIVTSRANEPWLLMHLVWTPQQGTVEEHSVGSPTDIPRAQLEDLRPNVFHFSPLGLQRDQGHYSSVALVCSWHKLSTEDPVHSRPRNNLSYRPSISTQPVAFLSWCYQRSLTYNFAGAMYPVGYRLVMESYMYSEREDEFDRVTDPSMGKRNSSLRQLEESSILKPRRSSKLPLSVDWINCHRQLEDSIVLSDVSSETDSADILPILSTCRITIIDGVLQIKPPSKARTALETWVMAQKSGHKKSPSPTSVGFDLREPQQQFSLRENQMQKLESVMQSIRKTCLDTDLVQKRTYDQQRMMIERIVKAEYFNAVKKMRGKEKMAARQQSKQALLVSLLKSSEEEKRLKAQQREMEEKATRLEVETLLGDIVGVVCDKAAEAGLSDDGGTLDNDDDDGSDSDDDGDDTADDVGDDNVDADRHSDGDAGAKNEADMDIDPDVDDHADVVSDAGIEAPAVESMDVDDNDGGIGDDAGDGGNTERQPSPSLAAVDAHTVADT